MKEKTSQPEEDWQIESDRMWELERLKPGFRQRLGLVPCGQSQVSCTLKDRDGPLVYDQT